MLGLEMAILGASNIVLKDEIGSRGMVGSLVSGGPEMKPSKVQD